MAGRFWQRIRQLLRLDRRAAPLQPPAEERPAELKVPAAPPPLRSPDVAAAAPPPLHSPDVAAAAPPRPPAAPSGSAAPRPPAASSGSAASRQSDVIVGIDFGTTFTSIAAVAGGKLSVLREQSGATMFPTVVCCPERDVFLVGWEARQQSLLHPATTFQSPKRLIGRRYDDRRIEPLTASMATPLRAGPNGQIVADVHGESLAIPQVCAHVFRHAMACGEQALGQRLKRVVLSAPVEYKAERDAIKRAAELAGLEVVSIIDEPIAAAIGYGLGRQAGLVAVYDFGGGTFDCTLLEVEGGRFRVLAKAGDAWLGGDDFDLAVAEHGARAFWRQHKVDLHHRRVEWQRLLMACEAGKRELSEQPTTKVHVPEIVLLPAGPVDFVMQLERALLEQLCAPLVERSLRALQQCLSEAQVQPSQVSHVAMTGGVSRMPLVRQQVEKFFGRTVSSAVDPQHAVVIGNAIYAHYLVAQAAAARA